MKKALTLVFLLCVTHIATAQQSNQDLAGTWALVSGEYIDNKGKRIAYEAIELKSLKVLSASHFSFTSVKGDKFWASGTGTYQWRDGQYKEILQYNSFGEKAGAQFVFSARVEGDFWYNTRWEGDKKVEYEVWRRISH